MPSEIALLTNPTAGKGRGVQLAGLVGPRLRDAGLAVQELWARDADEALDMAHGVVADGVPSLAVVGGDGMVHLAAQALAGSATRLGVIPAGTGNDVARYLDIPRRDARAATDVLIAGRTRTIDLARTAGRYFVTVLAAGFDAIVNERANRMRRPRGQMRYNLATLAELRTLRPLPYVLDVDGEQHRFDGVTVAIGNGPSFGGGLRITEGAELDDGLLDVVAFGAIGRAELVRTYPKLFRGTHLGHPECRRFRGRSITVAAPGIVAYADGERIGALPLTVDVVPAALQILVP